MGRMFLLVIGALLVLGLTACLRKKTPEDLLAALAKEVEPKGGSIFRATLEGRPLAFLMMDCKVYLLTVADGKVNRERVVSTGFYLGFTTCTGQSMRVEDGFVLATLSNQAIGAGGGNISGGTYRTKDGRSWEKKMAKGWLDVEKAQD